MAVVPNPYGEWREFRVNLPDTQGRPGTMMLGRPLFVMLLLSRATKARKTLLTSAILNQNKTCPPLYNSSCVV